MRRWAADHAATLVTWLLGVYVLYDVVVQTVLELTVGLVPGVGRLLGASDEVMGIIVLVALRVLLRTRKALVGG